MVERDLTKLFPLNSEIMNRMSTPQVLYAMT